MKASELIYRLSLLIEEHGDMQIFHDCDSILEEIESVGPLGTPYFDPPVFVISLPPLVRSR